MRSEPPCVTCPSVFSMPNRMATAVLNDVATEELAHLEMVSTIVHQLTQDLSMEEIEKSGFGPYYIDHGNGIWPQAAGGFPLTPANFRVREILLQTCSRILQQNRKPAPPMTIFSVLSGIFRRSRIPSDSSEQGKWCISSVSVKQTGKIVVKFQRRGKPTNSALLESHYQSEHLQDIGISRPICCYTSK